MPSKSYLIEPIIDLPSFYSLQAHTVQRELELPSAHARLVTRLSPMEVATMRCYVPPIAEIDPSYGPLSKAAAHLAMWDRKGTLQYMGGRSLALAMTGAAFRTAHPFPGTRRGLQILADLDASPLGVEVHCSTLRPSSRPLDRYERVRLSDRLSELAA